MGVVSWIPVLFIFFTVPKEVGVSKGSSRLWFFQALAMFYREHCDMINLFVSYSPGWTAGTLPACYVTQNGIPSNRGSLRGAERKSLLFHCNSNDKLIWQHYCLHTVLLLKNWLHKLALRRTAVMFSNEYMHQGCNAVPLSVAVLVCCFEYPDLCLDLILNLEDLS